MLYAVRFDAYGIADKELFASCYVVAVKPYNRSCFFRELNEEGHQVYLDLVPYKCYSV